MSSAATTEAPTSPGGHAKARSASLPLPTIAGSSRSRFTVCDGVPGFGLGGRAPAATNAPRASRHPSVGVRLPEVLSPRKRVSGPKSALPRWCDFRAMAPAVASDDRR